MTNNLPPLDRLKELFHYDPTLGTVTALKCAPNRPIGSSVGAKTGSGYLSVSVDGKRYLLHRLIWLLHYEEDADDKIIDHVDHDRANNKITNLRLVSAQQNHFNRSEVLGYTQRKGKYVAQITKDYKNIHLGTFDCPLLARLAYEQAKADLHLIPA